MPTREQPYLRVLAFLAGLGAAVSAMAQEATVTERPVHAPPAAVRATSHGPVAGYFVNRFSDLGDMLNLRLRGGLGLSAHVRASRHIDLFGGSHKVWNLGIPGYDHSVGWGPWWEPETEHGLVFFGVDATDDTPYEIGYSDSEFDLGIHLLLVGGELGIDPVEIGDFLVGIFGADPAGDDIGSLPKTVPPRDSVKPAHFDGLGPRLEFVRENFNQDLDRRVHLADEKFAGDQASSVDGVPEEPSAKFRLGVYAEFEGDRQSSISLDTDFRLDVELPNLQRRLELFITREEVGELPGTNPTDRENRASRIGLARQLDSLPLRTDAGVRFTWPPEAFAGIEYRETFTHHDWNFRPRIRFFYETDEGFGHLSGLGVRRWLGDDQDVVIGSISAVRITERTQGFEVEQNLAATYVGDLLDPSRRGKAIGVDELVHGISLQANIRGHVDTDNAIMDRYRTSIVYRRPLFGNWIFLVLQPELEWENDNDWSTVAIVRLGADLVFWRY